MQYFVSIGNSSYFHWQIELLIQSFKMLNLQDQLIIAIAEDESKTNYSVTNLMSHQNVFRHENFGKKNGNLKLNKQYALLAAVQQGILTQPFCVIHPDMVIVKPIKTVEANIEYHHDTDKDLVKKDLEKKIPKLKFAPWLNIGNVMSFKDVPTSFFESVLKHSMSLGVERAGLMFSIYEHPQLTIKRTVYEIGLTHLNLETNFVHYRHGLPAVFNKRFYQNDFCLANHPYEEIKEHNSTLVMNFLNQIVNSYKAEQ